MFNHGAEQSLWPGSCQPGAIGSLGTQQGTGETERIDAETVDAFCSASNHAHPFPREQKVVGPARSTIQLRRPQREVSSHGEIELVERFPSQV